MSAAEEAAAWPLLAEAEQPQAALIERWTAQALAGAGADPAQARRRWQGLRRQAAALLPLAKGRLLAADLATLQALAEGEPPDLAADLRRRVATLLTSREEAHRAARTTRDQLRAAADLTTEAGRRAYLAALAAAAAQHPIEPLPLAAIGAATAAALGVRLRNAQRLLTALAHTIAQRMDDDASP